MHSATEITRPYKRTFAISKGVRGSHCPIRESEGTIQYYIRIRMRNRATSMPLHTLVLADRRPSGSGFRLPDYTRGDQERYRWAFAQSYE